jgi:hypothetical protein
VLGGFLRWLSFCWHMRRRHSGYSRSSGGGWRGIVVLQLAKSGQLAAGASCKSQLQVTATS